MSAGPGERRIPIGPLIAIVGALLLLVSLFLDWWEGLTAFTVFEVLDLVLAALALATIAALAEAVGARLPGVALSPGLALPLAAGALVIVVSQLLNDPPAIVGTDRGPDLGLWLALGGSLLAVAGAALTAARISLALDLERREPVTRDREPAPASADDSAGARMRRRAAARAASDSADAGTPKTAAEAPGAPRSASAPSPDAPRSSPGDPTTPLPESERTAPRSPPDAPERPGDGPPA